jgi:hypothetical protein
MANSAPQAPRRGYAVATAACVLSNTWPRTMVRSESSTWHLVPVGAFGPRWKTLCGQQVMRHISGEYEPAEATCRECKRRAGIG